MTKIRYGRINVEGRLVGYATWQEEGHKIELFHIPYGKLEVKVDGKKFPEEVQYGDMSYYAMMWTRVAGWLGVDEFCRAHNIKQNRR